MSQTINNSGAEDKATMRRLGTAVFAMCIGALGLVVLAITIGHKLH